MSERKGIVRLKPNALTQVVVIALVRFYQFAKPVWHQVAVSVFGFSPTCKHQESCSNYTIRMIENHGTISGLYQGLRRVRTCWSL